MAEPIEGLELAQAASQIAEEMQAEDIVILDLQGISQIADFFVICTAASLIALAMGTFLASISRFNVGGSKFRHMVLLVRMIPPIVVPSRC